MRATVRVRVRAKVRVLFTLPCSPFQPKLIYYGTSIKPRVRVWQPVFTLTQLINKNQKINKKGKKVFLKKKTSGESSDEFLLRDLPSSLAASCFVKHYHTSSSLRIRGAWLN